MILVFTIQLASIRPFDNPKKSYTPVCSFIDVPVCKQIIRINGMQITQIERIYADLFYQRLSVKSASSAF